MSSGPRAYPSRLKKPFDRPVLSGVEGLRANGLLGWAPRRKPSKRRPFASAMLDEGTLGQPSDRKYRLDGSGRELVNKLRLK
jgi:hypothetical protein